jgi:mannitol/fructose-specific phosphotransferase system IIA component (Ntr-type)
MNTQVVREVVRFEVEHELLRRMAAVIDDVGVVEDDDITRMLLEMEAEHPLHTVAEDVAEDFRSVPMLDQIEHVIAEAAKTQVGA